jgi:hypothetical protein
MLTTAQIKERATYIGSSDAKTVATANYDEWDKLIAQKKGEDVWKPNKQTQLLMDAGSHLEPFIIDKWAEQEKRQVDFRGGGKTILRNRVPLHSTFDGRVVGSNAPLEIKAHFGFKDIDELADFYAPQCQHHMIVAGVNVCFFVAMFGVRCRIEWRMLKKDERWCEDYLANCKSFWAHYQGDTPHDPIPLPPVDHSDMYTIDDMRSLDGWTDEDDHLFGFQAQHIIDSKEAVKIGDEAKNMFKDKLPKNCRRMDYDIGGNLKGHKIRITRSRSGTMTCSHIAPKEAKDD